MAAATAAAAAAAAIDEKAGNDVAECVCKELFCPFDRIGGDAKLPDGAPLIGDRCWLSVPVVFDKTEVGSRSAILNLSGEEAVEVVSDDETIDLIAVCCSCWSFDNLAELRSNWDAEELPSADVTEGTMLFVNIVSFEVDIEVAFAYLLR